MLDALRPMRRFLLVWCISLASENSKCLLLNNPENWKRKRNDNHKNMKKLLVLLEFSYFQVSTTAATVGTNEKPLRKALMNTAQKQDHKQFPL